MVAHWTQYAANHVWPGKPEKFHLVDCAVLAALENMEQRGGVVTSAASSELKSAPSLGYSDSREALVEQGFTPCRVCNP